MESRTSSAVEGRFYVYLQKCVFNGVKCPVFQHIPWGGGSLTIIALNSGKYYFKNKGTHLKKISTTSENLQQHFLIPFLLKQVEIWERRKEKLVKDIEDISRFQ